MGVTDNDGYVCGLCLLPKTKFTDGLSIIKGKWYCDRCAREIESSEHHSSPFKTVRYGCPDNRYWHRKSCDDCPRLILNKCTANGIVVLREVSEDD